MLTTIHDALLVVLIDSGRDLDGTNILELMKRGEDNVLAHNMGEWSGNRDEYGSITVRGRKNILHNERDMDYVDALIAVTAAAVRGGDLFA
jgi:hypothetical protein